MIVKKGQYYTFCCHQDLERADEDFEHDEEDDLSIDVWDTLEEAIEEIKKWWKNGEEFNGEESVKEFLAECDQKYKELKADEKPKD